MEATPEINTEFKDSFQPAAQVGVQVNGQSNWTHASSSSAKWEPMEDSESYIASLGTGSLSAPFMTEAHLVLNPPGYNMHHTSSSIKLSGRL